MEAIESFSTVGNDTFKRGFKVRADHPAVKEHRALFMPADLDDVQKAGIRRAYWAESYAAQATTQPGPASDPVAQPPSGRFVPVRSWQLADDDLQDRARINAGDILAFDDPVVQRYWHLFQPYIETR